MLFNFNNYGGDMNLEHDLLQLARDAMRSLMNGRDFAVGQTGHYLNIISRIEAELSRPKSEPTPVAWAAKSVWGDLEGLSFDKQPRFDIPLYALEVTK